MAKFTIEIEEFYLEESELSDALQSAVKNDVVNQIKKLIEDKIDKQITMVVKEEVEKSFYRQIQTKVGEIIGTEKIKISNQEVLLVDYIKNQFVNNSSWNSPNDHIKKLADQYAKDFKARYDLQFASLVVQRLNEQGMLKENVAQMLLKSDDK